jgi:hypothetical protein
MEGFHPMKRAFIGCEFSGAVRREMREAGVDCYSCDYLPAEDGSPFHLVGDALSYLNGEQGDEWRAETWDLIGLHYTCTFFANSGVQWLYLPRTDGNPGRSTERDPARWAKMKAAAVEFAALWKAARCGNARVYFENPVMHYWATIELDRLIPGWHVKPDQIIQPFDFGHPESKKTGLWLHNLPPLTPTKIVRNEMARLPKKEATRVHFTSPGPDRWKERSRTLPGIAKAFASQWGAIL